MTNLAAVPIAITSLGRENYGQWLAVISFCTVFSFIDLGIPSALINLISTANQKKDSTQLYHHLQTAYTLLTRAMAGLGVILALALTAVYFQWEPTGEQDHLFFPMLLFATGTLLFTPCLSIATKCLVGLQKTHIVSVCEALAAIINLTTLAALWFFKASPTLILGQLSISALIAPTLATIYLRSTIRVPQDSLGPDKSSYSNLLSSGRAFALLQLLGAITFGLDLFLVSQMVDFKSAAELGVVNRLFSISVIFSAFISYPLWPAIRDAMSAGDTQWLRKAIARTVSLVLASSLILTTPILLFHNYIFSIWTNDTIQPSFGLVCAAFMWTNILNIGSTFSVILNSLGKIYIQVTLGIALAIANIGLAILLTPRIGASGVVIASLIAYPLTILLPLMIILRRHGFSIRDENRIQPSLSATRHA